MSAWLTRGLTVRQPAAGAVQRMPANTVRREGVAESSRIALAPPRDPECVCSVRPGRHRSTGSDATIDRTAALRILGAMSTPSTEPARAGGCLSAYAIYLPWLFLIVIRRFLGLHYAGFLTLSLDQRNR